MSDKEVIPKMPRVTKEDLSPRHLPSLKELEQRKEVMPLINGGGQYGEHIKREQRDADQKWSDDRLAAKEKEWAKKEAGELATIIQNQNISNGRKLFLVSRYIAQLRQEAEQ